VKFNTLLNAHGKPLFIDTESVLKMQSSKIQPLHISNGKKKDQ